MVKIVWQDDAETKLPELKEEREYMHRGNRVLIMSRVDDKAAIDPCQSSGINMFQGFYVDNLLDSDPVPGG